MQPPSLFLVVALTSSAAVARQELDTKAPAPTRVAPTPPEFLVPSLIHWQDFDCDGRLDAYSVTRGGRNRLLRNDASGAFVDVTDMVGLAGAGAARVVAWGDGDADGWMDLACVSEGRLLLLRNLTGRSFQDLGSTAALDDAGDIRSLAWIDIDGDELPELLADAGGMAVVYRNIGALRFERVELNLPVSSGLAAESDSAEGDQDPVSTVGSGRRRADQDLDRASRGAARNASSSGAAPGAGAPGEFDETDLGGGSPNFATTCRRYVKDLITSGCIELSTVPTLGMLYPLSVEFNVDATGNVGIGTATPGEKLEIVGGGVKLGGSHGIAFHRASDGNLGLRVGIGAQGNTVRFYEAGNVRSDLLADSAGTHWDVLDGELDIRQGGQTRHSLVTTNGRAALGLTEGVGIGGLVTTNVFGIYKETQWSSAPGSRTIRLNGSLGQMEFAKPSANPSLYFSGDGTTSNDTNLAIAVRNSSNTNTITLRRDGRLYAAGNVGVGVSVPTAKLEVRDNDGSGGPGSAAIFAENTSTTAGIGIWAESNGADAAAVFDQDGIGPIIKGFSGGVERFSVNNNGRIVNWVNAGGGGQGSASLFTTNDSTSNGVGIWTKTVGTDTTLVVDQVGSGPLIKGFTGGVERFSVNNNGRVVNFVNTGGGGPGSASLYSENTTTSNGVGIWTRTRGTDTTLVVDQAGTGPLIKGFVGGQEKFAVTSTGRVVTTALQITGGGDLVEGFDADENCAPGSVVVIDAERPGRLKLSHSAYDRKVAGVVSGAGGVNHGIKLGQDGVLDGETLVAMTGRVWVQCSAENGAIAPGDRLTTAALAGHAMKATDASLSDGAVIGKAMTALESGAGLVLVLVNLQ